MNSHDERGPTDRPESAAMPFVEYGAGWLRAFAEETALANGRSRILRADLPVTKGLRSRLRDVVALRGPTRLDVERAARVVDLSR